MNGEKGCPFSYVYTVAGSAFGRSCTQNHCEFWNKDEHNCAINVLVKLMKDKKS